MILLMFSRYLYNESVTLHSVTTALNTLYAAHKYMCPGLAKKVVEYLQENLTEVNVLLVLQHICLFCYCSNFSKPGGVGSGNVQPEDAISTANFWDVPVTTSQPSKRGPAMFDAPTAPLAEHDELLDIDSDGDGGSGSGWCTSEPELTPTEDDVREFEAGMAVAAASTVGKAQKGRQKVNCCEALLKQCLDLIDEETSAVIKSEDFEGMQNYKRTVFFFFKNSRVLSLLSCY